MFCWKVQKWIPFEVRMEGIDVNNFWTKTCFKMFQLKPFKICLNLYYFTMNFALVFLKGSCINNFPQFWAISDHPLPHLTHDLSLMLLYHKGTNPPSLSDVINECSQTPQKWLTFQTQLLTIYVKICWQNWSWLVLGEFANQSFRKWVNKLMNN